MRHASILLTAGILLLLGPANTASWAQQQTHKLEVTQPQAGAELGGMIEVRVKITPPEGGKLPSSVYVGFGPPLWTEMDRLEEANQWAAKLDSTLVPNGAQAITVISSEKRARGAVEVTVQNPLKYYFADLHSHTSYSDGMMLSSIAHDYARNVAKLDVFSLTDHLESVDDAEWLDTREVAWKANEDGQFESIPGLEWTKKHGHACIYDPKTRFWPQATTDFYKAAADAGVVAKFNHPGDGSGVFDGMAYSEIGDKAMQMMEVRHPVEEQAFIRALNQGWHIAPDGSDDTHSANWGNVRSWTVILAPGLSKENVLDALMNRRCFSTLDRNCLVHFSVNGAVMGSILEEPAEKVDAVIAVDEADDDDLIAKIELFEDGEVVQTEEPNSANHCWETSCAPEPGKHYYFAKVTQADGNFIWSAPVWVTVAEK